jgi:hypothetical protein
LGCKGNEAVTLEDRGSNAALVTKTLVHNGAAAVADPSTLDLPAFLDFASLCDASVILDRLEALESADDLAALPLTAALRDMGLLGELRPRVDPAEIRRVLLRLPPALARHVLLADDMGTADPDLDLREPDALSAAGAVEPIDYERGIDSLLAQLDELITYPSMEPAPDPRARVRRSIGYLLTAAADGLDYFPDFDRAPFVSAFTRELYRSLPVQLYERVAAALGTPFGSRDEIVAEWTLGIDVPIPPVTSLVLQRARSLDEVPERLLEVREEFAPFREHFATFKRELHAADTLNERRRLQRRYGELLAAASGPDHEVVSATEVLNLAEKTIAVAAAPLAATSYSATLVGQPIEWLRRWWLQRPLAVLFRLDGKLPRISEYRQLIARLWGAEISDDLLRQYLNHGRQVQALMAPRAPAGLDP